MEFLKNRNLAKSNTRNPGITLLSSIRGNCPGRGTYAHPDLAMAIAMWAHPSFLAEVSGWIRELLITGKVELGKEKSPEKVNEKLEETFQAIDEDEKLYLREKRCLELSLLRIECDKRKREDEAFDEDIVAKRVRRQRDEEEYDAKRKRDDAVFDEEMRVRKEKGALELVSLKKKEELDYNNLLMPFVDNIQNRTNDAHVKALCKDIGMALLKKAKFLISGENSTTQETRFCEDVTTIGRRLGFNKNFVEQYRSSLGKAVVEEYRRRNNDQNPQSTEKYVNSSNHLVYTYDVKDKEWIDDVVCQYLSKKMQTPIVPISPKAPSRTIKNYFTQ